MLNYSQTVEWMFQQLPMYQRIGADAFKKDLTNILKFSKVLDEPHRRFKSIHVAGTNGKGSTSHMLASIFQEAGYKVGLYTSPHLKDYRERIKVNGNEIAETEVVNFITRYRQFLITNKLSFFEMSVGMAFDHFANHHVDIAIVEVGLGGRLDSTNIILPELSIITNIGLDHTQMLGDTLELIASEKGGIIKPGVPVVIGETQPESAPVFKSLAKDAQSKIIFAEDLEEEPYVSDLKGDYQQKNIKTVVAAIRTLSDEWKISEENLLSGLLNVKRNTGLKGRWEILQEDPKVICDTAHNAEGLKWVMKQLKNEHYARLFVVLGVVNDKDLAKILPMFPREAKYFFCKPDVPRGMDVEVLAKIADDFGLQGEIRLSVSKAYEAALEEASKGDLIYVGGSTFTVAEII